MPTNLSARSTSMSRAYCRAYSSASLAVVEAVANALLEEPADLAASIGSPRSLRTTLPPSGSGSPVFSCHQTPRSTTRCSPWFWNVSWPSWMMSPASYFPAATARDDLVERHHLVLERRRADRSNSSRSVRNAVVSVPGTAIFTLRAGRRPSSACGRRPSGRSGRPCCTRSAAGRTCRAGRRRRGC